MCGIVGVVSNAPVNQLLYDALLLLQHRGQDAAGIVTLLERKFFMHKAKGMVRDVFRTRNMRALPGSVGLGQVRYPTAGNAFSVAAWNTPIRPTPTNPIRMCRPLCSCCRATALCSLPATFPADARGVNSLLTHFHVETYILLCCNIRS